MESTKFGLVYLQKDDEGYDQFKLRVYDSDDSRKRGLRAVKRQPGYNPIATGTFEQTFSI